jgi:hypothetical protein
MATKGRTKAAAKRARKRAAMKRFDALWWRVAPGVWQALYHDGDDWTITLIKTDAGFRAIITGWHEEMPRYITKTGRDAWPFSARSCLHSTKGKAEEAVVQFITGGEQIDDPLLFMHGQGLSENWSSVSWAPVRGRDR